MRGHIAEKNGRYYPVISIKDQATGKWKRKWLSGFRTKREAEKARAEAVTQVNNGWLTRPSRETVAQLFRDYFCTTGANRVRPITLQSYRSVIENHLISKVGAKPASALTPDDLNHIMKDMIDAGKSKTTTRYMFRIAHRVLEDAVRKGKLTRNVTDLADPPSAREFEVETWDEVELDSFLTAAADSEYYEFFSTLALIGARRGEGLGLQWGDADFNITSPTLHIRRTAYKLENGQWRYEKPKTKRSDRIIALPVSLALLLQQLRKQKEANAEWSGQEFSENDFMFAQPDGSLPDPRYLSKVFQRIVQRAGLKRIRLHDLRHTFAINYLLNGGDIFSLREILGHTTLDMVNHYLHFTSSQITARHHKYSPMDKLQEGAISEQPVALGYK